MGRSDKRKASHQTGKSARRVIRRRVHYLQLSLSKMSDLQESRCEDMRVHVLLKNTYYHLKNSITTQFTSWGQEDSAHQPTHSNGMAPLSPTEEEHRLQDGGMAPEPTVANSKPPNAGDLPSNAPQTLVSDLEEEEEIASVCEPQLELHCDTFFGDFQIQAPTSFQDQDDLFSDVEMSEFESIPVSVANGGQPSEEAQEDPQLGAKPFSDQKENDIVDLEHFVELLINAE